MHTHAISAAESLQRRASRTTDNYELERYDRALDELVGNLQRPSPSPFQRRSAMANASKVIAKRRSIRNFSSLDAPRRDGTAPDAGAQDGAYDEIDLWQWLDSTPSLSPVERHLLRALALGDDAMTLASRHGVPVTRMRERVSRARSAGRRAYHREVLSA